MPPLTPQLADRVRFILKGFADDKFRMPHCTRLLIWEIDESSVAGVLEVVPSEVRAALRAESESMPRTEAGWEQWIDIYVVQLEFSPTTPPEEIVQWQRDAKRDTRRGIEALRSYFEKHAV